MITVGKWWIVKMMFTPWKLTWQWMKIYVLLKMVIFQCHVSFQGCKLKNEKTYIFSTINHFRFQIQTIVKKKDLKLNFRFFCVTCVCHIVSSYLWWASHFLNTVLVVRRFTKMKDITYISKRIFERTPTPPGMSSLVLEDFFLWGVF